MRTPAIDPATIPSPEPPPRGSLYVNWSTVATEHGEVRHYIDGRWQTLLGLPLRASWWDHCSRLRPLVCRGALHVRDETFIADAKWQKGCGWRGRAGDCEQDPDTMRAICPSCSCIMHPLRDIADADEVCLGAAVLFKERNLLIAIDFATGLLLHSTHNDGDDDIEYTDADEFVADMVVMYGEQHVAVTWEAEVHDA